MKYYIYIFCLLGILAFANAEHDIHVSTCSIEEIPEENKLSISLRIFYDDLLSAVGLKVGEELPEDYGSSDEMIQKFISEHLIIEINGETKVLNYIESNSFPPAVWTTLEIENVGKIKEIKFKNTILLDVFEDQKNIINLEWKGKKKTLALDKKQHLITLK